MGKTGFLSTWEFLKRDLGLTFKHSLLLSAAVLFFIPVIRGISNLNRIQSAECLGQSAVLMGILLLIPVGKEETEQGIRELVRSKSRSYLQTLMIRLGCGMLIFTAMVAGLEVVMKIRNCEIPFFSFTVGTALYGSFLGLLGLVAARAAKNMGAGYLAAVGYWVCCQTDVIREGDIFYFFPVINGDLHIHRLIVLFMLDAVLAGGFLAELKR